MKQARSLPPLHWLVPVLMAAWALAAHVPAQAQTQAQTACGVADVRVAPTPGFAVAAAHNAPAVVNVIVMRQQRNPEEDPTVGDYFPPMAAKGVERTTASGFVISPDGYIVTSAHGVHDALEVWVVTADGRRLQARVVGFDRRTDVGVLRIDASGLPAVQLDAGTRLCAGERVAALGSPFGFDHSVTSGVVSANPRFMPGNGGLPLIQTDVAINPGSSGGPLFNAAGTVVGMNSMIYSASGIYIGVSFALPIERVLRVAAEIRAKGRVERGDIGTRTQPVSPELAQAFGLPTARGALVTQVEPGSPAERAGLRGGDILLAMGSVALGPDSDPDQGLAALPPGRSTALEVWRERQLHKLTLDLTPAPAAAASSPTLRQPASTETRLGLQLAAPQATPKGAAGVSGIYVEAASGSALLAGVEPGDRISAVNCTPVASAAQLDAALQAAGNLPVVALLVVRGGSAVYLAVRRRGS